MLICGREVLRIKEAYNVSWDDAVSMYIANVKGSVGCRLSGERVINQKSGTVERFDRPPRPVPDRVHTICKYHSIKHNRVVLGAGCRVEGS